LGNPDYASLDYSTGSEVYFLEAFLEIYYPEDGFVFYSGYQGGLDIHQTPNRTVDICLEAEDVITRVHLLEPGLIEDIIANRYLPWAQPQTEVQATAIDQLIQWPGFTCVNLP
jgi:hypothetical protein